MEPWTSTRHGTDRNAKEQVKVTMEQLVYEAETPKWRSYYERVRKTIRFPRYYKKAQNW